MSKPVKKPVKYIDNWATSCSRWQAPEAREMTLLGVVAGKQVITSPVVSSRGWEVETQNTVYRLGKPDQEWVAWLNKQGIELDQAQPVKVGWVTGVSADA